MWGISARSCRAPHATCAHLALDAIEALQQQAAHDGGRELGAQDLHALAQRQVGLRHARARTATCAARAEVSAARKGRRWTEAQSDSDQVAVMV